ncbi:MAG TPA: LacI family DNA-binding transcriptional regulator [Bradyrhizobium sp.]|uniref:LacI family DNA-binding transcriptional regulator n=1 Tax=Bradyrhizobium sp. TaxID=376 RepID=UPI002B821DD7|nr:LacI family DNA-binding transcriptional regulator [Bradyrhizobium sp.]HLZ02787.1 LacI family DNA-binding transcriptional regulator [Bradyrhizobium sp.]
MTTISDVAELAGVSIATVSAVINDSAPVRPALRQRVLSAIDATKYQPHSVARSLKTGISRTIGLVISDVTNPFFGAIARTIESTLQAQGYALMLCNSDEDPEKEERYLRLLQSHRVSGIVIALAGSDPSYGRRIGEIIKAPAVLIDRTNPVLPLDSVTVDNAGGTLAAITQLLAAGRRRIGIVLGPKGVSTSEERLAGYQKALLAHDIAFEPRLVRHGYFRQDEGFAATRSLLAEERPDAIFAANNLMAIGALKAIAAAGLVCPRDVSIACFDDFEWAAVCEPKITTVEQPTEEIGRTAVSLLFERIRGTASVKTPRRIVLPARLISRTGA